MNDPKALAEEERKVRELARTVDLALVVLSRAHITRSEAEMIVSRVRAKALAFFPDKASTFDLIYQPRFNRVLAERFGLH